MVAFCFDHLANGGAARFIDLFEHQAHARRPALPFDPRPDDARGGFDRLFSAEANDGPGAAFEWSAGTQEKSALTEVADAGVHGDVVALTPTPKP